MSAEKRVSRLFGGKLATIFGTDPHLDASPDQSPVVGRSRANSGRSSHQSTAEQTHPKAPAHPQTLPLSKPPLRSAQPSSLRPELALAEPQGNGESAKSHSGQQARVPHTTLVSGGLLHNLANPKASSTRADLRTDPRAEPRAEPRASARYNRPEHANSSVDTFDRPLTPLSVGRLRRKPPPGVVDPFARITRSSPGLSPKLNTPVQAHQYILQSSQIRQLPYESPADRDGRLSEVMSTLESEMQKLSAGRLASMLWEQTGLELELPDRLAQQDPESQQLQDPFWSPEPAQEFTRSDTSLVVESRYDHSPASLPIYPDSGIGQHSEQVSMQELTEQASYHGHSEQASYHGHSEQASYQELAEQVSVQELTDLLPQKSHPQNSVYSEATTSSELAPFFQLDNRSSVQSRKLIRESGASAPASVVGSEVFEVPEGKFHARQLSCSSIASGLLNRHVNLASLKRTIGFRPGEGERSLYVETIRKSAGTAYNESGPVKWKLPTGIMPVDKRVLQPMLFKSRANKSSGVELKHGHLKPRLLAAEVDELGSSSRYGALGRSTLKLTPVTLAPSFPSLPSVAELGVGSVNSLERQNTVASADSLLRALSRRDSIASVAESVGSISDTRKVDIYYQHPAYLDDKESVLELEILGEELEAHDEDDKPRLFLANPDDSD